MSDEDPTKGAFERGVDSFISDLGGFALAWGRTWGLHLFRPWRASELLLADEQRGFERYVSPGSFLLTASLLVSFFMSVNPFEPGYVGRVADAGLKLMQLDADVLTVLVGGVVQAGIFYSVARGLGLLAPTESRDDRTTVAMYVFPAAMFGFVPAVLLEVVFSAHEFISDKPYEWIISGAALWGILLAPSLSLGFFGWNRPGRWGRWTAVVTPLPLVAAVFYGTAEAQFAMEDSFGDADLGFVWLAPISRPEKAGYDSFTHSIELRAWHDRPDPVELCQPRFCPDPFLGRAPPEGAELPVDATIREDCVPARFQLRGWIPPDLEVELALILLTDDPALDLRHGTICCQDKEICFQGYEWPDALEPLD